MAEKAKNTEKKSWFNYCFYALMRFGCRMGALLMCRGRFFGLHNVLNLDRKTGLVVVANHQSHFDPPLVGSGIQQHLCFLARKSLFTFGPFGWLIGNLDAIPLNRDGIGIEGIKKAIRFLRGGRMLVLFPEGTRTPDGEIKDFKPGFTTLARRSKVPILPVSIEGAYDAWPKGTALPRPAQVHLYYGVPIMPEEYDKMSEEELVDELRRRIVEGQEKLREHPHFAKRIARRKELAAHAE